MMTDYWSNLMDNNPSNAANYMLTYGEGPGSETRLIISEFINSGETVLDVACGPGWNMDHFTEYGPRLKTYKGVDLSPLFVDVANQRRKAHKDKFPRSYVEPFEVQDCRHLSEPDNSWDIVLLQDILEHTNGYQKPITEALRVAKKRVIIVMWQPFTSSGIDKINDDRDKGDDGYGSVYGEKPFKTFLDNSGYEWMETETSESANRFHKYFIIDKEI